MSALKFNVAYEDAGEGWVYAHVPELEERRERGEAIPQTGWTLVEPVAARLDLLDIEPLELPGGPPLSKLLDDVRDDRL